MRKRSSIRDQFLVVTDSTTCTTFLYLLERTHLDFLLRQDLLLAQINPKDGTPYNLVMKKQTAFYKMIAENKDSTALIQAAMMSH